MKKTITLILLLVFTICHAQKKEQPAVPAGEIIYHVFQRSFYDSNGDHIGDLNGLRMKLDYLQDLGITSLLLLPLYESVYYHNYFAIDFKRIDPAFGTTQDYLDLVKEVHRRGMKIYMDMETQYVTEDQDWWMNGDHILYKDAAHKEPESIVFGVSSLTGYNGVTKRITTTNLYNTEVQEYNFQLFKYFTDPDGNGRFDDGVDGFRLDHMMDDLDYKGRLTDLFSKFWSPLLTRLRQVNPQLKIVAEQANWGSYGTEYFEKGNVDRVFAFRLQQAIASFDKDKIAAAADTTLTMTPAGKQQVVFIENHDMQRFASAVHSDPEKLKIGAALNLLIGGIPSIYYGQELGMKGAGGFGKFGVTDGNDIPMREAFEWYKTVEGKGMALWYKETGAWWDSTNLKAEDGISLEEERFDGNSIWNFYKRMIRLRQIHPALATGEYHTLNNGNNQVYTFVRYLPGSAVVIAVNLSGSMQQAGIEPDAITMKLQFNKMKPLNSNEMPVNMNGKWQVTVPGWGIGIWESVY